MPPSPNVRWMITPARPRRGYLFLHAPESPISERHFLPPDAGRLWRSTRAGMNAFEHTSTEVVDLGQHHRHRRSQRGRTSVLRCLRLSRPTAAVSEASSPEALSPRDTPWLAPSYPPGVPTRIDPDAYPSLHALLLASCHRYAARPAFRFPRRRDDVCRVGSRQRGVRGSSSGSARSVAKAATASRVMLPNMLAYPVAYLGILRAGLTVVGGVKSALHAARARKASARRLRRHQPS